MHYAQSFHSGSKIVICNSVLLWLQFDTKYYYEVGIGNTTRQFWFITPPRPGPDVPYTFGLIGIVHIYLFILILDFKKTILLE
jgi:hypothetical protein